MTRSELDSFNEIWSGILGPPGTYTTQDSPSLDWDDINAWAAGNSISVDQGTLDGARKVVKLLVDAKKKSLVADEMSIYGTGMDYSEFDDDLTTAYQSIWDDEHSKGVPTNPGITWEDIHKRLGCQMQSRKTGNWNSPWPTVLRSLIWMIENGHAYATDSTGAGAPAHVTSDWEGFGKWLAADNDHSIQLTAQWNLYVYAKYSALENGQWKLYQSSENQGTISSDVAVILGETLGRSYYWLPKDDSFTEHGNNQYRVRQNLCDKAHLRIPCHVTTEEYYSAFSKEQSARHMHDSYMLRQYQDKYAATFEFVDTAPPEYGRFLVDSRLIRWRELNRIRGREH